MLLPFFFGWHPLIHSSTATIHPFIGLHPRLGSARFISVHTAQDLDHLINFWTQPPGLQEVESREFVSALVFSLSVPIGIPGGWELIHCLGLDRSGKQTVLRLFFLNHPLRKRVVGCYLLPLIFQDPEKAGLWLTVLCESKVKTLFSRGLGRPRYLIGSCRVFLFGGSFAYVFHL